MFEENKDLVNETENVEGQTTEENVPMAEGETETINAIEESKPEEKPKQDNLLTKEQVDEMIAKKLARKEDKIRKEYEKKYGKLESVINAGLGTNNTDEALEKLTDFYTKKGINIPTQASYSDRDIEILARDDARDIISLGYDEMVEEGERLAKLGNNMSKREKLCLEILTKEMKNIEEEKDLSAIGVSPDALKDSDYQDFASKLNPSLSVKEKYEIYLKFKPKPKVETMGSMKSVVPKTDVKEYYTPEEVSKLSMKDLDDPKVMAAVEKSMALWEQNK